MDKQIFELNKKYARQRTLKRIIALLCVFVMLFTVNSLKMVAQTLTRKPMCGLKNHLHKASCYDSAGNLICGKVEHQHTDACYQEAPPIEVDLAEDLVLDTNTPTDNLDLDLDAGDLVLDDGQVAQAPAAEKNKVETPSYKLGSKALLSKIIRETGLKIKLKKIKEVGIVDNDGSQVGLVEIKKQKDGDYRIKALRDFARVELAIVLADEVVVVELVDGVGTSSDATMKNSKKAAKQTEVGGLTRNEAENEQPEPTEQPVAPAEEAEVVIEEQQPAEQPAAPVEEEAGVVIEEQQPAEQPAAPVEEEAGVVVEEQQPAEQPAATVEEEAGVVVEDEQPIVEEQPAATVEEEAGVVVEDEQPIVEEQPAEAQTAPTVEEPQAAVEEMQIETPAVEDVQVEQAADEQIEVTDVDLDVQTDDVPAPVEEEVAPAEVVTAPAGEEAAPAEEEVAPVEEVVAPVEEEVATVEEEVATDEEEVAPGEEEIAPAEEEIAPTEVEVAPAEVEVAPAEEEAVSAEVEVAPVEEEVAPAEEEVATVEEEVATAEEEVATAEEEVATVEEEVATVEEEVAPAEVEVAPAEEVTAPVEEEVAPAEVETAPVEEGQSEETEQPATADEAQADEEQADEEQADEAQADEEQAEEEQADEAQAEEEQSDEVQAEEAQADEEQAEEEQADEAQAEEEQAEEEQAEEEQAEEEQAGEATQAEEEQAEGAQDEEEPVGVIDVEAEPTEVDAEQGEQEQDEAVYTAGSKEIPVNDAVVTLTWSADAHIPEDVVITIEEIEKGTPEYDLLYHQALAELPEPDQAVTQVMRFFDITLYTADGKKIEPKAPVSVVVTVNETIDSEVNALHCAEVGAPMEAVEANAEGEGVAFDAPSFSVYGVNYNKPAEEKVFSSKVQVDLSSVDTMAAAKVDGMSVSLSVSDLLAGTDDAVESTVDSTVDAEQFVAEATVSSEDITVENGTITLPAEALDKATVQLSVETKETDKNYVTTVTTHTVDIVLSDYAGRTEETVGEGVTVKAVGENSLPADAVASVEENVEVPEQVEVAENESAAAFDINLTNKNGDAITGPVAVTVMPSDLNVLADLPEGTATEDIQYQLIHVHDDGSTEIVHLPAGAVVVREDGKVESFSFETVSFSTYVFKYTVDFEYTDSEGNVHTWSFQGTGSHKLSEVLAELGIEAEVITAADLVRTKTVGEYGKKDLYLTQADGEWFINSDAAFDDTYELTVVADGTEYEIIVKDNALYPVTLKISDEVKQYFQQQYNSIKICIVAEQVTGSNTWDRIFGIAEIDKTENSKSYDLQIDTNYEVDSVYIAYNTWNSNNLVNANCLINQGSAICNSFDKFEVKVNRTNNSATITIGDVGPVPHTAHINFYEAGSSMPNSTANLVSGYTLEATVGGSTYVANITGTGVLTFTKDATTYNELPDDVTNWTFKYNGNALTAPIQLGDYVVSTPTTSGTVYTFEARKPVVCTASITVDDAAKLSESHYYYVVARKDNANVGYAQITATGPLSFTDGTSPVTLDDSTTFWIAKSVSAFADLSSVDGAEKIEESGSLGWYDFTIPASADSSNVYIFNATKQAEHSVSLHFTDASDQTVTPNLTDTVYLVGKVNGVRTYYAPVTAAGSDPLTFLDASNDSHTDDLPGHMTFALVTSAENILTTAPEVDAITVDGTEYGLSPTLDSVNHKYDVNLVEKSGYRIVMNYLDANGDPDSSVALDGNYYVVFRDNSIWYYAPLRSDGSVNMSAAKNSNNQAVTGFDSAFAINDTYFVKVDSGVQNPVWGDNMNVNDGLRIKNGGLLDVYKLTYPSQLTGNKYVFNAQRQLSSTFALEFYNGTEQITSNVSFEHQYYLAGIANTNEYYYAAIDMTTGEVGPIMTTVNNNNVVAKVVPEFDEVRFIERDATDNINGTNIWGATKIENNGKFDEYTISYPTDLTDRNYVFTARKAAAYIVEIRFEDGDGNLQANTIESLSGARLYTAVTHDGETRYNQEDINLNGATSVIKKYNKFSRYGAEPQDVEYAAGDDVTVMLATSNSFGADTATGLPQMEKGAIKGTILTNGSAFAGYKFTVTTDRENGRTTYVGTPITDKYTVEVHLADKSNQPVNTMPTGYNYVFASIERPVGKSQKTYYMLKTLPAFADGFASVDFDVFENSGNQVAYDPEDLVDVCIINNNTSYADAFGDLNSSVGKIDNGTVVGGYYFTTADTPNKTTYYGKETDSYGYIVKALNKAGQPTDIVFNDGPWYVYAEVTRSDGTYIYAKQIGEKSDGSKKDGSTVQSVTGSISGFYGWKYHNGYFTYLGETYVIPGENITFGMVRPTDHGVNSENHDCDMSQSTTKNPANTLPTNGPYAYFGDTAHMNVRALEGSSVDNNYTLHIQAGTGADEGKTVLVLQKPADSTVSVKAYDTTTVSEGQTPDTLTLNRTDGQYYILATMTFRDGVEDKVAYAAQALSVGTGQSFTFDSFACKNLAGGNETHGLTGTRYYEPSLVFVPDSAGLADAGEVVAAFIGKNTDALTVYENGSSVEQYRMTATGGTKDSPNTEITLTKLPVLYSEGKAVQADGATVVTELDSTYNYYILAELDKDGVMSYAYRAFDSKTLASSAFEAFKTSSNTTHYFAAEDKINFYIVKSANKLSDLNAVINNGTRYAEGQLMGKYIPSFALDKATNTVSATLKEYKVNPRAYTVKVDMLSKDQTGYSEESDINTALGSDDYYVLAWLTPKDSGSDGQPLAWKVLAVNKSNLADGCWSGTVAADGFAVCDSNGNAIDGETVGYDPALFDLNLRLYHSGSEVAHATFNDIRNSSATSKPTDAPPTGYDFKGIFTQAKPDNTLPAGASFASATIGDNTSVIRLHEAYDKVYGIKVNVEEAGLSIPEDEYAVRVVLDHETGDDTYAFAKLVVDSSLKGRSETALEFYTDPIWHVYGGGAASSPNDILTGKEKGIRFEILSLINRDYNGDRWTKLVSEADQHKDYYNVMFMGDSINKYTVNVGDRISYEEYNEEDEKGTLYIYDVLNFTKDTGTLTKGYLDEILENATNFGLYTEDLHLHATDMESNIGAAVVTGPIGADYGFSNNNVDVNQIKVIKRYVGQTSGAVTLKLYKVQKYHVADGSYVLEKSAIDTQTVNLTADGTDGVAEFNFTGLRAGMYVIKEVVNGQEYAYRNGVNGSVETNQDNLVITFADEILEIKNINENINYFGDIQTTGNFDSIVRHSRHGIIVTDQADDYTSLQNAAALNGGGLATIYQTHTDDYPMTYDIPADMVKLRTLSSELANLTSSQTVRVLNVTKEHLDLTNGLKLKDDGRYIVVNIDMTNAGSVATVNVDTFLNNRELMADFGQGGREDSSKVLYNFVTRDSSGNWVPYTGKINTATQASGILLAPSAIVANLAGNWGGTIICHQADHTGSEIHSDNNNKIQKLNTLLTNAKTEIQTGDLEIQKELVGDTLDNSTYFNFTVTLRDTNNEPVTGSYLASGLREGTKVDFDGGVAHIQVRANNKVHITAIPAGYKYLVEEEFDAANNHYQLVQIENEEGEIQSSGTIEVRKTVIAKAINARKTGGLTVAKTVVGDHGANKKFSFRVTLYNDNGGEQGDVDTSVNQYYGKMKFTNGVAEFKLGDGESLTAKDIPVGTWYKIEEIDHDQDGFETALNVTPTTLTPAADKSVTGQITTDENGKVVAVIAAYSNSHTDDTTYTPKVTKKLKADDTEITAWPDGARFDFRLSRDAQNEGPTDGLTLPAIPTTFATQAKKTASFGAIKFTKAGTYTFSIEETVPSDAVNGDDVAYSEATSEQKLAGGFVKNGIEYASAPLKLEVVVETDSITDPQNPKLVVKSVKYGESAAVTENIGDASGEVINNRLPTTERHATKQWVDNNDANQNRPTSITFTLSGTWNDNGTAKGVDLSAFGVTAQQTINPDQNGEWPKADWTNLPVYTLDGKEITYSVAETPVNNYRTSVSDLDSSTNTWTVTNTELTERTAKKEWVGVDNSKLSSITYTISRKKGDREDTDFNARPTSTVSIVKTQSSPAPTNRTEVVYSGNNYSWNYTWTDLEAAWRIVGGSTTGEYEYTVKETGFVYDGVTYTVTSASEENNPTYTVSATIVPSGKSAHPFLTTYDPTTGTFTNTLNETHIDVNKKWWSMDGTTEYTGDLTGKEITLTLHRMKSAVSGGKPTYDFTTFTLDGSEDVTATALATLTGTAKETEPWVASFDGLPLAGVEGNESYTYSYYVTEAQVAGFDAAVYTDDNTTAFPTVDQQKAPSTALVVTDRSGKIVYIHNKQMQTVALPATGGPGTTLYYVAGSALLLLALALLLRRKRNYD